MTAILTSIHGSRVGLDTADNLIIQGKNAASAFIETAPTTAVNLKPYGTSVLGSTASTTYTLDGGVMDIGAVKRIRAANATGTTTINIKLNSGSTTITFDGTLFNLSFQTVDSSVTLVKESATRIGVYGVKGTVTTT